MTIRTNDEGFKIFDGGDWGPFLVIEHRRIQECLSYLKARQVTRVHLNGYHGSEASDLSALSALSFIDGLTATIDLDVTELQKLTSLRVLGLPDSGKDRLNLSWFPELEVCAVTYSKRLSGLQSARRLRELTLTGYASVSNDLREFPDLPALEKLVLIKSTIESLSGIGRLPVLRHIEASFMSKLVSVADLIEVKDTLEVLILDGCKKVRDHAELGELIGLRKLILGDCGQLPSLQFIARLKDLEFLSFVGTKVLDGDLTPCLRHPNLKYVGFDNKKHYSHKLEEVRQAIEARDASKGR